jgi:P4 family phage/plasmid primase-like protien
MTTPQLSSFQLNTLAQLETKSASAKLKEFLEKHRASNGTPATHTSLIGGAYAIPDEDMDGFWDVYCDAYSKSVVDLFLTEKPKALSGLRIDIDFRLRNEHERAHDEQRIIKFVSTIMGFLNDYIHLNETEYVFVMEKPPRKDKPEHDYFKDGLHIVMPQVYCCYNILYMLRDYMLPHMTSIFDFDKVTNTPEDVYDLAVIARNNWMLYGSRKKNELHPWKVTRILVATTENDTIVVSPSDINASTNRSPEYLTMRPVATPGYSLGVPYRSSKKEIIKNYKPSRPKKSTNDVLSTSALSTTATSIHSSETAASASSSVFNLDNTDLDMDKITKLVDSLNPDRANEYASWCLVVWGIYNVCKDIGAVDDDIRTLIHDFSKKSVAKYREHEVDNFIDRSVSYKPTGEGVGIGTLIMYLQEDAPGVYTELFPLHSWKLTLQKCFTECTTHRKLASIFFEHYKTKYMYTTKNFYKKSKYNIYTQMDDKIAKCYLMGKMSRLIRPYVEGYYHHRLANIRSAIANLKNIMSEEKRKIAEQKHRDAERELKRQYVSVIKAIESDPFMKSTYEYIKSSEYYLNREAEKLFNSAQHLIPFNNGVYDLNEKCFRLPREDEYISTTVGYDYHNTGFADAEGLIDSCMSDPETALCLKKYLGSVLCGGNKDEKVVFWVGNGGNGKSLVDLSIRYTLGDFYMVMPGSFYTSYDKDPHRSTSLLMSLKNKRLAVCSETDENVKFVTANFTKTSGGDAVTGRANYGEQETFEPTHKCLIHTNYLPTFTSITPALFRRIIVIMFNFQFKEAHEFDANNPHHKVRDESLKNKVKTIDFRCQMMNMMIHYHALYEKEGLTLSQAILDANKEYRKDLEIIYSWASENLVFTPGGKVPSSMVYDAFKMSLEEDDDMAKLSQRQFSSQLKTYYKIKDARYNGGPNKKCVIDYVLKTNIEIVDEDDELENR